MANMPLLGLPPYTILSSQCRSANGMGVSPDIQSSSRNGTNTRGHTIQEQGFKKKDLSLVSDFSCLERHAGSFCYHDYILEYKDSQLFAASPCLRLYSVVKT